VYIIINKFRQTESLLGKKEPNQNAECPLKRNWMRHAAILGIFLLKIAWTLHTGDQGLSLQSEICSVSENEFKYLSVNTSWRCKVCMHAGTISSICCYLGGFCL
jgi:hypothetical protein